MASVSAALDILCQAACAEDGHAAQVAVDNVVGEMQVKDDEKLLVALALLWRASLRRTVVGSSPVLWGDQSWGAVLQSLDHMSGDIHSKKRMLEFRMVYGENGPAAALKMAAERLLNLNSPRSKNARKIVQEGLSEDRMCVVEETQELAKIALRKHHKVLHEHGKELQQHGKQLAEHDDRLTQLEKERTMSRTPRRSSVAMEPESEPRVSLGGTPRGRIQPSPCKSASSAKARPSTSPRPSASPDFVSRLKTPQYFAPAPQVEPSMVVCEVAPPSPLSLDGFSGAEDGHAREEAVLSPLSLGGAEDEDVMQE